MNERFPQPTEDELDANDRTCIICREDMIPETSRTLHCTHIFHATCLRNWLQHQQVHSLYDSYVDIISIYMIDVSNLSRECRKDTTTTSYCTSSSYTRYTCSTSRQYNTRPSSTTWCSCNQLKPNDANDGYANHDACATTYDNTKQLGI